MRGQLAALRRVGSGAGEALRCRSSLKVRSSPRSLAPAALLSGGIGVMLKAQGPLPSCGPCALLLVGAVVCVLSMAAVCVHSSPRLGLPRRGCPLADGGGCGAWVATAAEADEAITFFAMSDWGGSPDPGEHFTTQAERDVAAAMGAAEPMVQGRFCLVLGDNFYDDGVKSETDARFATTFQAPFSAPGLQRADFFRVVAGNHDYHGNVSAQMAYTRIRHNWYFPEPYYTFTEEARRDGRTVTVQVIMLDTTMLVGCSQEERELCPQPPASGRRGRSASAGSGYAGPWNETAAQGQWAWLEATLSASYADFVLVAGHHPVLATCFHAPAPILRQRLLPLLEEHGVSAYLSGHDHCAQHIRSSAGLDVHVLGAGHSYTALRQVPLRGGEGAVVWDMNEALFGEEARHSSPNGTPTWDERSDIGAFAMIRAGWVPGTKVPTLSVAHVDSSGRLLYTAPPRTPAKPALRLAAAGGQTPLGVVSAGRSEDPPETVARTPGLRTAIAPRKVSRAAALAGME